MAHLGDYLVRRRQALGLDRKEVADRSGLSYPYVSQLETGARRPSTKALRLLADALEVSVSELLAVAGADVRPSVPSAPRPSVSTPATAVELGWYRNSRYAEREDSMPSSESTLPSSYGTELSTARHELIPRLRRQLREYSPATRLAVLHDLQADALADLAREQGSSDARWWRICGVEAP